MNWYHVDRKRREREETLARDGGQSSGTRMRQLNGPSPVRPSNAAVGIPMGASRGQQNGGRRSNQQRNNQVNNGKCFACGEWGHRSVQCPARTCFHCGQAGHRVTQCPEKRYEGVFCQLIGRVGVTVRECPECKIEQRLGNGGAGVQSSFLTVTHEVKLGKPEIEDRGGHPSIERMRAEGIEVREVESPLGELNVDNNRRLAAEWFGGKELQPRNKELNVVVEENNISIGREWRLGRPDLDAEEEKLNRMLKRAGRAQQRVKLSSSSSSSEEEEVEGFTNLVKMGREMRPCSKNPQP